MSSPLPYRTLDPEKLIRSIDKIAQQVSQSFPHSGLAKLSTNLATLTRESITFADEIRRPMWGLRILVGILILLALIWPLILAPFLDFKETFTSLADFLEATDAGLHMILVIGAGVVFLVGLENRIKRNRTLDVISSLRSTAHIIDMHQITKDPGLDTHQLEKDQNRPRTVKTDSELAIYLDFCSDMLSIIGKLGAFQLQYNHDRVILEAVNEIETLSTGLSSKLWQKIMVINHMAEVHARETPVS
ncbi:MAG: hypothetical protein ACPG32_05635 [Akkermansiaceae bacterium]